MQNQLQIYRYRFRKKFDNDVEFEISMIKETHGLFICLDKPSVRSRFGQSKVGSCNSNVKTP